MSEEVLYLSRVFELDHGSLVGPLVEVSKLFELTPSYEEIRHLLVSGSTVVAGDFAYIAKANLAKEIARTEKRMCDLYDEHFLLEDGGFIPEEELFFNNSYMEGVEAEEDRLRLWIQKMKPA